MGSLRKKLFCLPLLFLFGCASGLKQASRSSSAPKSGRTVVLFLVDGLAVKPLKAAFRARRLPALQRYFLRGQAGFAIAQAGFPTLTYSNTAAILTAKGPFAHPVISNQVLMPNGRVVNFEKAEFHPALRSMIDRTSLFGELGQAGKETASFSYVFGFNADHHMRVGVREGLEYKTQDFEELDGRLLESLEGFLQERPSSRWPEFIYVHLIGVDAIAHKFGPDSPELQAYLGWLDTQLQGTLRALSNGERTGQNVVTILTSDHGFVSTPEYVPVAKQLRQADLDLVITNEGRFLGLHLSPTQPMRELEAVLKRLIGAPGVELVAWRNGSDLELLGQGFRFRFAIGPARCDDDSFTLAQVSQPSALLPVVGAYQCPTAFDPGIGLYPFPVAGLSRYLNAPGAPNAVVVAKPGVSFTGESKGSHGGLTADEVLIPLLLRNAGLRQDKIIPSSELLRLLRESRASH